MCHMWIRNWGRVRGEWNAQGMDDCCDCLVGLLIRNTTNEVILLILPEKLRKMRNL